MKKTTLAYSARKYLISAAILIFTAAAIILAAFIGISQWKHIQNRHTELERILSEDYDSVFLSMYPITNYSEEDFATYRGIITLKSSYSIQDTSELNSFLDASFQSGNALSFVYLGFDPAKIWKEAKNNVARYTSLIETTLLDIIKSHPEVNFEILLSYPSLHYWRKQTPEKLTAYIQAGQTLFSLVSEEANATVYFFGDQEWLIANPDNYSDEMLTNTDVSKTIMLNVGRDHSYWLTPENVSQKFSSLETLFAKFKNLPDYPDYSDRTIVFFGDSVIGNYTGSLSIPGVVKSLTGAASFNCGYGGNSAALGPDIPISLPGIAEAFVQKDLSKIPSDTQVYQGVLSYLTNETDAPDCFIINYGLNDYFTGYPVSSEDPCDITTYKGAIRKAVTTLREAYPDAVILLLAPTFCTYFSYGTEKMSPQGGVLTDYVEAAVSLAEELDIPYINNYEELGINADNELDYLADGCHPNETGRFLMGSKIVEKLAELL